jgi:hypothetical protein
MTNLNFKFPTIGPLIARHAEDASFYWTQLDRACDVPDLHFARFIHFQRQLQFHNDGLQVAGTCGWTHSFSALSRWKKAGETYVCTRLALHSPDDALLESVMKLVRERPDELLRGVISGVASSDEEGATAVIKKWSSNESDPFEQVVALRTATIKGGQALSALRSSIESYLSSPSPHVRAAACRAASSADSVFDKSRLQIAATDVDLAVRAEAVIGLARFDRSQSALEILREAVISQAQHESHSKRAPMFVSRRLRRWVLKLSYLLHPGSSGATTLLDLLPKRVALHFILCHGDPSFLPFVVEQMACPINGGFANWIYRALTGIVAMGESSVATDGSVGNPSQYIPAKARPSDLQLMLSKGNIATASSDVSALPFMLGGHRVLLGKTLDLAHAIDILADGPQAVRIMAAEAVNQTRFSLRFNACAEEREQQDSLISLRKLLEEELLA